MSTNERILDQIVEEVQGVIAKMDEHDLEQAMPLITKNSRWAVDANQLLPHVFHNEIGGRA